MNYMKNVIKSLKKTWYIFLFIIPIVILTIMACKKKIAQPYLVCEKTSYFGIGEKDIIFSIPLYVSNKFNFYLNKDEISSIHLMDNLEKNTYLLNIKEITKQENDLKYQGEILSKYNLKLEFSNYISTYLKIPSASLVIKYQNDEKYPVDIGSIVFFNENDKDIINIKSAKGIVNNVIPKDNIMLPTTTGLYLNLLNDTQEELIITDIILLNGFGEVDKNNVTLTSKELIDSTIDINTFLNGNYQLMYKNNNSPSELKIKENSEQKIIIPISYLELHPINQAGLIIITNKGIQIINVFPIFNSSNLEPTYTVVKLDQN